MGGSFASGIMLCGLLIGLAFFSHSGWVPDAGAKTIYSYIDEHGNPVFTDTPDTIPERYKAKVRTHEQLDQEDAPASVSQSIERRLRGHIREVRSALPKFSGTIYGLTSRQSEIVTYAGAASIVLLLMTYVGKNPFTRLLGFGLLILLGIAVPVLIYISDDGPADRMQKAATAAGQAQQERLQQVSH